MKFKKKIEQKIKQEINLAKQAPCILCGGESFLVGQFIPYDSKLFGVFEGKQGLLFYSLCLKCALDYKSSEKVEMKFMLNYCKCEGTA